MTHSETRLCEVPALAPRWQFWHASLGDLLRGRFLAWRAVGDEIRAADLPPELARMVYTVARHTRLWTREQVDVTRELSAHFRDGLDAGRAAAELAADFGDPRQAARLIRRACLRRRPLWWQLGRGMSRMLWLGVLACLLWFVWNLAWFWWGQPRIARNFVAEMNQATARTPADARAWPIYRQALIPLYQESQLDPMWTEDGIEQTCQPGDPDWQSLVEYLDRHAESLALARAGARRPQLGYIFGDPADSEYQRLATGRQHATAEEDDALVSLLMPHMQDLRRLSRLLACDTRRALAANDSARVRDNLETQLRIAEQAWDTESFLIGDLVAAALFRRAMHHIGTVLREQPAVFGEDALRDFSHRLERFANGNVRLRLRTERQLMLDTIQRVYSDDGQGNGSLTNEGYEYLRRLAPLSSINPCHEASSWYEPWVLGPVVRGVLADRAALTDLAMGFYDRAEIDQQGPLHQWPVSTLEADIQALAASPATRARYALLLLLLPGSQRAGLAFEHANQHRVGLQTALAAELFRRRQGTWPATLAELSPAYLPQIPLDSYTGEPLGYVVTSDGPAIYSRGADRRDDGGKSPAGADRVQAEQQAGVLNLPGAALPATVGYDWVLWPPAPRSPSRESERDSIGATLP